MIFEKVPTGSEVQVWVGFDILRLGFFKTGPQSVAKVFVGTDFKNYYFDHPSMYVDY